MPSRLRIPEAQIPHFKKILDLTDEQATELYSALEDTPPSSDFRGFVDSVASRTNTLNKFEMIGFVGTLYSIYRYRDSIESASWDVPRELAVAYAEAESISEEDERKLVDRLTRLLGFYNSLGLSAKASDVLVQNNNSFTDARVITDIRPIFSSNDPSVAKGAVVVHMLKIEFLEGDESREFFVALNTKDVETLKTTLERAEVKEKALNALLQNTLPIIAASSS